MHIGMRSAIIVTPGGCNMELFDLYDDERRLTGETIERGDPLPESRYHLVIHICIFNSEGKMLIQQRQPFKKSFPGIR